jgi:hypothetical protein
MLYKDGFTSMQVESLGRLSNEYTVKEIYLRSGNSFWSRLAPFYCSSASTVCSDTCNA